MTALTIITVLFTAYIAYVWIKWGIQFSISASIYVWKHTNARPWTSRLILMLLLIWIGITYIILIPEWYGFITGASIAGIGIAGDYQARLPWVKKIHNWLSFIGIIGAMLSIGLHFGGWNYMVFVLFMPFAIIMFWQKPKNYIWWVEKVGFYIGAIGLYVNL